MPNNKLTNINDIKSDQNIRHLVNRITLTTNHGYVAASKQKV